MCFNSKIFEFNRIFNQEKKTKAIPSTKPLLFELILEEKKLQKITFEKSTKKWKYDEVMDNVQDDKSIPHHAKLPKCRVSQPQ